MNANAAGKVVNVADSAAEMKRLNREVAELRNANEILKVVSVTLAKELDRL